MLPELPLFVYLVFLLSVILTLFFLTKSLQHVLQKSSVVIITIVLLAWMAIQAVLAYSGFYLDFNVIPPRFPIAIGIPLLVIILLFAIPKTRKTLGQLPLTWLTYLHVVRIPVEITIWYWCLHEYVPELITFEGRNFDIIAGLTAPLIAFYGIKRGIISKGRVLLWNFICLGLLLNVVILAVLSAPLPFQQFAFDRPNVAVFYFPNIWLPALIVPAVLFAHLVSIYQLIIQKEK